MLALMDNTETAGDRIRHAMQRKNITQTALAEACGVSQPTLSEVIRGEKPGRTLLPKIAKYLKVPLEWLTVGDTPPEWATPADPILSAEGADDVVSLKRRIAALNAVLRQKETRLTEAEARGAELAALLRELQESQARERGPARQDRR
jgi:transcriptional regulator with XRE-family HTH domain